MSRSSQTWFASPYCHHVFVVTTWSGCQMWQSARSDSQRDLFDRRHRLHQIRAEVAGERDEGGERDPNLASPSGANVTTRERG
ncbi:hypothetical protein L484_008459 [Morus notabilis]|uniref:Uncharacterized protein n=1 Tax=Morus notabilis TaxID=981085 RepID=W9RQD2_9ROSA|nr:hypothetical protein L484_008459 [Morus notabilis]